MRRDGLSEIVESPGDEPGDLKLRRLGYGDLPSVIAIERRSFPTPWSLAMFVLELSKPSGICLAAEDPDPARRPHQRAEQRTVDLVDAGDVDHRGRGGGERDAPHQRVENLSPSFTLDGAAEHQDPVAVAVRHAGKSLAARGAAGQPARMRLAGRYCASSGPGPRRGRCSAALTRRLTSSALGEVELHEDRVDVLLDGALGEHQRLGDRRVALALRDLGEHLAARAASAPRAASVSSRACARDSTSTTLGSITEPPAATGVDRGRRSCARSCTRSLSR